MATRDTQSDDLIPTGEAARRMGVSVDTVRRWEAAGRIQSVRTVGNQRRFRIVDCDALLAESVA